MTSLPAALPPLVIFDWDDTLVDTYPAIHAAINAARAAFGLPAWSLAEARVNCRLALKESFPQWFGAEWERAGRIFYDTFAKEHLRLFTAKRGAVDLLRFLRAKAIPLAVNSNKKSLYLRKEISFLEWDGYFHAVVGADDVSKGKPDPAGVNRIKAECGIGAAEKAWYIGDNAVDCATARAGECLPVILAVSADEMHGEVVFKDISDFLQYLQNNA